MHKPVMGRDAERGFLEQCQTGLNITGVAIATKAMVVLASGPKASEIVGPTRMTRVFTQSMPMDGKKREGEAVHLRYKIQFLDGAGKGVDGEQSQYKFSHAHWDDLGDPNTRNLTKDQAKMKLKKMQQENPCLYYRIVEVSK